MCTNCMLQQKEELDTTIVEKYNTNIEMARIEFSMIEIIDNLEKLYMID